MNDDLSRLVERLGAWRQRHGGRSETPEARDDLKELLCANEDELRAALAAVDQLTYPEMMALLRDHGELNVPEGVDVGYARQLVDAHCDPNDAGDWTIIDTDDHVNMLKRVVEYAQYV